MEISHDASGEAEACMGTDDRERPGYVSPRGHAEYDLFEGEMHGRAGSVGSGELIAREGTAVDGRDDGSWTCDTMDIDLAFSGLFESWVKRAVVAAAARGTGALVAMEAIIDGERSLRGGSTMVGLPRLVLGHNMH